MSRKPESSSEGTTGPGGTDRLGPVSGKTGGISLEMSRSSNEETTGLGGTDRLGPASGKTGGISLEMSRSVSKCGMSAKGCVLEMCVELKSFSFSDKTAGGFDEQEGVKDLLLPKRLLVLARRVVRPVTLAGLACLLAGSTRMVQHPVGFVRVLVRVGRFRASLRRLVELHAQVVVLMELD